MITRNITIQPISKNDENRTLAFVADAIAGQFGNVKSTVPMFDGEHDLAIIEWAESAECDETYVDAMLDADDDVIEYR